MAIYILLFVVLLSLSYESYDAKDQYKIINQFSQEIGEKGVKYGTFPKNHKYSNFGKNKIEVRQNAYKPAVDTFKCPFPWGEYPVPKECSYYYKCLFSKAKKTKCPDGKQFDKFSLKCTEKGNVSCANENTFPDKITFKCPKTWGTFTYSKDCSKHYLCLFGKANVKQCDSNELFDEKANKCLEKEKVDCNSRYNPYVVVEKIKCPKPNGFFVKPGSYCKKYIDCNNNIAFEKSCPHEELFSEEDSRCDWKELVTCKGKDFLCPKNNGVFLMRNTKCKSYVICKNGKAQIKKCLWNTIFNSEVNECEWEELITCKDNDETTASEQSTTPTEIVSTKSQTDRDITSSIQTKIINPITTTSRDILLTTSEQPITHNEISTTTAEQPITHNEISTTTAEQPITHKEISTTTSEQPMTHEEILITITDQPITHEEILITTPKQLTTSNKKPNISLETTTLFPIHIISDSVTTKNKQPTTSSKNTIVSRDTTTFSTHTFSPTSYEATKETVPESIRIIATTLTYRTSSPRGCVFGDESCQPDEVLCPEKEGEFAHPDVSTIFIHCDHWRPYIKKCPEDLHFDPELKACNWPKI